MTLPSGKSSLILTLLRLLNPTSGHIHVDGLDLTSIPHEELRSRFVAVADEPFILPGTVRQNLDPYDEFDADMATEALKDMELWTAVEQIGGLEATLGKDMLSHGQMQLFNCARAILRRHHGKILILDEVTSRYVQYLHLT
jgi:ATP-binding cassette subfamily C (CFTR/MRP) protein 1